MNRFAPSTTGRAHPGTLLAALLCWLDARHRSSPVILRLEDLDPQRCTDAFRDGLLDDLQWLGLDWDQVERQGEHGARHAAALDELAAAGRLYACTCSRARLRERGRVGPDGGYAYDNQCRSRVLSSWRDCDAAIRIRIDAPVVVHDESGADLSMDVAAALGDPIVRRRDGAVAYHLASVVDDAALGVDRGVRGRDLATSTAPQVAIQQALGLATPVYRHHLLLLERRGSKLAKFHGAVGADVLRQHYQAPQLCAWLAAIIGQPVPDDGCAPEDLIPGFSWHHVPAADQVVDWDGARLRIVDGE